MIRPILGATAAIAFAALPAFAASTEKFEMSVEIDRAALETPAGAEQEFTKIRQDVHERCIDESKDWPFSSVYAVSFCEQRTLKSAITKIDNPNLTAAYKASQAR